MKFILLATFTACLGLRLGAFNFIIFVLCADLSQFIKITVGKHFLEKTFCWLCA